MKKWIKTSERLPNPNHFIEMWFDDGHGLTSQQYIGYMNDCHVWNIAGFYNSIILDDKDKKPLQPIYWKELDDPPSENKKNILNKLGKWKGDDFEECYQTMKDAREKF